MAGALDRRGSGHRVGHVFFAVSALIVLIAVQRRPLFAQNVSVRANEYMNAQVRVNHFEGVILIARSGEILIRKHYGSTDRQLKNKSGGEIRFPVGSIGKQFVAVAILQLREQGKLQLQDSVCVYISNCPVAWQPVTILNLLTQTSGIPDINQSLGQMHNSNLFTLSPNSLIHESRKRALEFAPGTEARSSAAGYEVLGAVVEKISGESCARYLEDHIFQPLGMRDTGNSSATSRLPRRALTDGRTVILLTPSDLDRSFAYSTGGIFSTAKDLYLWDRAFYTEALISKKSIDEMSTPYRDGYGLGWFILKQFGRETITQGSGIDLFHASVRRYPDDDSCIIVLGGSRNIDAARISNDLAAILFTKGYELPMAPQLIKLDPSIYDAYVGRYALRPDFFLTVTRQGERLMAQGTDLAAVEILPESETRFFLNGVGTKISFVRKAGQVTGLVLQQSGLDIPAQKAR